MPEDNTVKRDVQLPDIPLTDEALREWIEKKKAEERDPPEEV